MPFAVTFDGEHQAAILSHHGDVDAEEITASRIILRECSVDKGAKGVVIDIIASEISANPAEIIANVAALCEELPDGVRLGFAARPESQDTVSLIVATVAFNTGARVGQFHALDAALCWISSTPSEARACGCLPATAR